MNTDLAPILNFQPFQSSEKPLKTEQRESYSKVLALSDT